MTDLLDGTTIPWHFIATQYHQLELKTATRTALPAPAPRRPPAPARVELDQAAAELRTGPQTPPQRRLVAGGMFVAGALAAHWRRGSS